MIDRKGKYKKANKFFMQSGNYKKKIIIAITLTKKRLFTYLRKVLTN